MNATSIATLSPREARLLHQAMKFFMHLGLCLAAWGLMMLAITLVVRPIYVPPVYTLSLSFCVPLLVAFTGARIRPSESATLTWLAGLIWFMLWGIYILDLPTGPSACYHCGATAKLWLTFLSLSQDGGLLDGQGRLLATWPAAAMTGYAIGARLGMGGADVPADS